MKFVIVIKKWIGGVGRYVKEVQKQLEKRGHEVKVISREDDLNHYGFRGSKKPLQKAVDQHDYDVLFTHDWSIAYPFLNYDNHITVYHGIQNGSKLGKVLQSYVANRMGENLIAVSERVKNEYPEATLNREGVDLEEFKPVENQERKGVGFPSNPEPEYNFFEIKEAVEKTDKPLYVVRNLPHEDMNKFYNSVDTVISLPPEGAGFNLVWLEAMAAGCKVVGTRKEGVGGKLPITYIEDYGSIEKALEAAERSDYREWIRENGYTWKSHVDTIMEMVSDGRS